MKQLLLFFLLSGSASAEPVGDALTVADVWQRHHELDGRIVRVSGVVTRCYRYGCNLLASMSENAKWIGMGGTAEFDQTIQPLLGKQIVVEGRLDARCLHASADEKYPANLDVVVCSDRASVLTDPKLVGVAR